jgi:hypothetical protein
MFEQYLEDLEQVFKKLKQAKLHLKITKCHFAKNKVKFLGHELIVERIKPNSIKVEAINTMKPLVDIFGIKNS